MTFNYQKMVPGMESSPNPWRGYVALTFAQAAIGVTVVASKYLLPLMPIYFILLTRFLLASIAMSIAFHLSKRPLTHPEHPEGQLLSRDWQLAILQGFLVGVAFNLIFLTGLKYTSAASAGIIASSLPAVIALLSFYFLKEAFTARKVLSIILATLGILVVACSNENSIALDAQTLIGDLLILIAMFPEASYSIINKFLYKRMDTLGASTIAMVVSTLCFIPLVIWHANELQLLQYDFPAWAALFAAGLSSLVFFWLWAYGVVLVPAGTAAVFGGVMPISTLILAIIFLHEPLFVSDLIGMFLIFIAIALGINNNYSTTRLQPQ